MKPSHITIHRHFTTNEEWQPWVVAVRTIDEVLPPGIARIEEGTNSQIAIKGYDRNIPIKESSEEVAALIGGAAFYLIDVFGSIDPRVVGPWTTAEERDQKARFIHTQQHENDALFSLDVVNGAATAESYSGSFFEEESSG